MSATSPINGDRIVCVGPLPRTRRGRRSTRAGLAVAPGFINMLSWANESLIADGRGQSDIRQGVTLEVMGEGDVDGPAERRDEARKTRSGRATSNTASTGPASANISTISSSKGVSPNVASFVGATTVRVHELGEGDVDPTPEQLARMRVLVRKAMDEGAMGVGSSLIYAPANFAETPELIALASEAGRCGGMYISHMRDEGPKLIEAIDELVEISEKSGAPAEIYHFKQSGRENWHKIDAAIARVEAARARGPADHRRHVHLSGQLDRVRRGDAAVDPGGRDRAVGRAAQGPGDAGQGAGRYARSPTLRRIPSWRCEEPDKVILVGFKTEALKPLTGKTLGEVARERGKPPEEVIADLIVADNSRIQVVYFSMSEENVARAVTLPWMSFGSDAGGHGAGGRVPQIQHPPARLWQFRPAARQICPRGEAGAAGRGGAAADLASRRQSRHRRSRRAEARPLSPTSRSSIPPRSPTAQHLPSRSNMRSAWSMCWSTAFRCCATANIPARRRAGS